MSTLREQILKQQDQTMEKVFVQAWGCHVFLKPMTVAEQEAWEKSVFDAKGEAKEDVSLKASVVVACACDEQGKKIFQPSDVAELAKKSAAPVNKLFNIASKLNGITESDVEELKGNSKETSKGKRS
jgi:hypothetical protein